MGHFDRAAFTAWVAKNSQEKATNDALFELLEFSEKKAFKIRGGKDSKTFQYIVRTADGADMLFFCDCSSVTMTLGNFPQLSQTAISHFVRKLHELNNGFDYLLRIEDNQSSRPCFSINETLVDPTISKAFKEAVLELQYEIGTAPRQPLRFRRL